MSFARRTLQVGALLGTLVVGMVALALIVSQTHWFKDWLRRYIVRQADQYLNGTLTIGELGGNLFFGVQIRDVAVEMDGRKIIQLESAGIDYSVFDIVSQGVVLNDIRLNKPVIRLERNAQGWNVARLVKEQRQEKDREGPARPISIGEVGIAGGHVTVDDRTGSDTVKIPKDIHRIDGTFTFAYQPVRFSIGVKQLSFAASQPQLLLQKLSGDISVADDEIYFRDVKLKTGESDASIDGVIGQYTRTPTYKFTIAADPLSVPEIARIVPALARHDVKPKLTLSAHGPADALALEIEAHTSAGNAEGSLKIDIVDPKREIAGDLQVERINLAPLLSDPTLASRITGQTSFALELPASGTPLRGTFAFAGPEAAVAGYEASNVKVRGRVDGQKVTLDGGGVGYGARATVKGTIVTPATPREQVTLNLRGTAANLDLRRLPRVLRVPALATNLSFGYQVSGRPSALAADLDLRRSTVEGATIADGTTARVSTGTRLTYGARGGVSNLDVQRLGTKLGVAAISTDRFASNLNAEFTLEGRGTTLPTLALQSNGVLTNSRLFGGEVPNLQFNVQLENRILQASGRGTFAGFNPGNISGNPRLDGRVGGTLDLAATLTGVGDPFELGALDANGSIVLTDSVVGGIDIDEARVDGDLRDRVVQLREGRVAGPALMFQANGTLALDETAQSNLKYTATSVNLQELGRVVDKPMEGLVSLEGQVSGNRANLRTTGTLSGLNVQYDKTKALTLSSKYDVTIPDLDTERLTLKADTNADLVHVAGRELREVTATTTYANRQVEFDTTIYEAARQLDAAGRIVLHPDHQEVHVRNLALATEGVRWSTPSTSEAAIQYSKNVVTFQNLQLTNGPQTLKVSGTLGLESGAPGALDVQATNVDLAQLDTLLLQNRGFGGQLSATAKVTGTTADPRVDANFSVANGAFRSYKFESLAGDVDYTPTAITLDTKLQQNSQEWLTARGTVPMTLFRRESTEHAEHVEPAVSDRIDLRIQTSTIGLGMVEGFVPQVSEVQGTVQADVHVAGSGRDPHLEGFVDLKGGAFKIPLINNTAYTGLDTRIELTPDKVLIKGFRVLDEDGQQLNVEGELATHAREVGAFDVRITSNNFEVIDNELGDVGVDTDLRLTGELRRPKIVGSVELSAGRLEVDRIIERFMAASAYVPPPVDERGLPPLDTAISPKDPTLPTANAETNPAPAAAAGTTSDVQAPAAAPADSVTPSGFLDALSYDVSLAIPNNAVLRGTDLPGPKGTPIGLGDLNITIGGAVNARKNPGEQMRLLGTVETVRGTYAFQGRKFDIVRGGTIQFQNMAELDPALDILASREITGIEVRVRVHGRLRAPELELTSDPAQDEADLLSLIVFNQPINELGEGERINLASRAGALATGFVAAPLSTEIAQALDVDQFELETSDESGSLGPRVTVGQQVGQRLYVKVSQQFGAQEASQFTMEYELADFVRLQASIAEGARQTRTLTRRVERGGADLIFFFSY